MEIKISTRQMLNILQVIAWIIFIGLCIEAGGIIFNAIFTGVLEPEAANKMWQEIDLSNLYAFDHGYFFVITFLISIVTVMKAVLFYRIIKILHSNRLDLAKPFSREVGRFIFMVSYLAVGIGLFSIWSVNYADWLIKKGVKMPDLRYLRIGGADVWLFMGVTLFVIAQIFKQGIEIQSENDLTV